MGVEDINSENTQEGGITPDASENQQDGKIQTPFDKELAWLTYLAEKELKENDNLPQPEKNQTSEQESSVAKVSTNEVDPAIEIQKMILERKDILQECEEMEQRIAQSLLGTTLENLPVTPNRIAIAHIGDLIQVLERVDPGVETVKQVHKRVTKLLELARLLKTYMKDVEEEARNFADNG